MVRYYSFRPQRGELGANCSISYTDCGHTRIHDWQARNPRAHGYVVLLAIAWRRAADDGSLPLVCRTAFGAGLLEEEK
jgi:hypothetical protein